MADDIDSLLDEVEDMYVKKKAPVKQPMKPKPVTQVTSQQKTKSYSSKYGDLNDDIDDIIAIPDTEPLKVEPRQAGQSSQSNGDSKKKCFKAYLAGVSTSVGNTTIANTRACDRLRCTDCDFKICMFDNFIWDSATDYLFLRNNIPDFSKLKSKLKPKSGSRAYACQCKWRNVSILTPLDQEKELKWVCGKHN